MCEFVEDQRGETMEIGDAGLVRNRDPFLRIKRDVGVPTAQLGPAEENADESEGGEDEEDRKHL